MGGKGGGGGLSAAEVASIQNMQFAQSQQLMYEQMGLQQQFTLEAEERAKVYEEEQRKREMERLRAAEVKKNKLEAEEEAREAQMLAQAGFTDEAEIAGDLGSLNLDATTIERPGYEELDERPE